METRRNFSISPWLFVTLCFYVFYIVQIYHLPPEFQRNVSSPSLDEGVTSSYTLNQLKEEVFHLYIQIASNVDRRNLTFI